MHEQVLHHMSVIKGERALSAPEPEEGGVVLVTNRVVWDSVSESPNPPENFHRYRRNARVPPRFTNPAKATHVGINGVAKYSRTVWSQGSYLIFA